MSQVTFPALHLVEDRCAKGRSGVAGYLEERDNGGDTGVESIGHPMGEQTEKPFR